MASKTERKKYYRRKKSEDWEMKLKKNFTRPSFVINNIDKFIHNNSIHNSNFIFIIKSIISNGSYQADSS